MVETAATPAGYRATHYTKDDDTGDIQTLGGRRADGRAWVMSAPAAIAGIEAALIRVMVNVDGVLRPAIVETDAAGARHLREGEYFVVGVR